MLDLMAMVSGVEVLFVLLLGVAGTALWIWALVDSGRRLGAGESAQLGWVIAIALTHVIGAVAYLLFGGRRSGG